VIKDKLEEEDKQEINFKNNSNKKKNIGNLELLEKNNKKIEGSDLSDHDSSTAISFTEIKAKSKRKAPKLSPDPILSKSKNKKNIKNNQQKRNEPSKNEYNSKILKDFVYKK
jgi:hypothetical protein